MFENLYHENVDVARHNNINDENQTIRHPFFIHLMTGGSGKTVILLAAIAAAAIAFIYKRKKKAITES